MEALLTQHLDSAPGMRGGAGTYDLPLAALHAGMAYYYEHQAEIDRAIEEDKAFAEAFERRNVSPLREKLKALSLG
jgi:hypothetical protein